MPCFLLLAGFYLFVMGRQARPEYATRSISSLWGGSVSWEMHIKPLYLSYRRRLLDACLQDAVPLMQGRVLDVGGRKLHRRGAFRPPRTDEWHTLDVMDKNRPDIVGDAHLLPIRDASIDTLVFTEVLEHVADPRRVVAELSRVLRPEGCLILSVPFLVPVHADPSDFWRFTEEGLRKLLVDSGFHLVKIQSMGLFFTVLADMVRHPLSRAKPRLLRWCLGFPFTLVAAALMALERSKAIKHPLLATYTTGYFAIARR